MDRFVFKEVGRKIQEALDVKNMSQQSLADHLYVSKQVMHKIINGSKAINVDELSRIARFFAVPIDDFLPIKQESLAVQSFAFMGSIKCEQTRHAIEMLKEVVNEILFLEELLDESQSE